MIQYNRVLVVVGGAAVIVSLTIGVIFVQADLAGASLRTDARAAFVLQTLGDQLVTEGQAEREAIDEFLMAADPQSLAAYRQAVMDESQTSGRFRADAETMTGVVAALARVDSASDAWRSAVADPAIAAVQSGSVEAIATASRSFPPSISSRRCATPRSSNRWKRESSATC